MKLTNELILLNLQRIHNADGQSLRNTNFIGEGGAKLKENQELLTYLIDHDLIETEDVDDIYFLTTYGYDVVEEGIWEDPYLIVLKREPQKVFWSPPEEVEDKKSIRISPFLQASIVVGIVSAYGFFVHGDGKDKMFNNDREKKEMQLLPQELLEQIMFQLDSLKNNP